MSERHKRLFWKYMSWISWFINYLFCWIYTSYILHIILNTILQKQDWPFVSFWKFKSLYFTCSHLFSFVTPLVCHSLSLIVICCHSLTLLSLVVTLCHSLYHSLSLVVIRCTTCCHLFSLILPLVVTHCHLMSHSSVFL